MGKRDPGSRVGRERVGRSRLRVVCMVMVMVMCKMYSRTFAVEQADITD